MIQVRHVQPYLLEMKMIRPLLSIAASAGFLALSLSATNARADNNAIMTAPPELPYKAVSSLVKLPDFIPGLGQLFVDPATLPAGPFLGYDRKGRLISTTYMIPLSIINENLNLLSLKSPAGTVDHVDMIYNAGHPGVEEPHVHVVLWNIPTNDKSRVAQ